MPGKPFSGIHTRSVSSMFAMQLGLPMEAAQSLPSILGWLVRPGSIAIEKTILISFAIAARSSAVADFYARHKVLGETTTIAGVRAWSL